MKWLAREAGEEMISATGQKADAWACPPGGLNLFHGRPPEDTGGSQDGIITLQRDSRQGGGMHKRG